ncbi:MAG: hypothetical protein KBS74_01315 [Clostridiales bacterium]|nr:hypothetical protein [Candidatus Cacconaster stercorequi]
MKIKQIPAGEEKNEFAVCPLIQNEYEYEHCLGSECMLFIRSNCDSKGACAVAAACVLLEAIRHSKS